MNKKRWAN